MRLEAQKVRFALYIASNAVKPLISPTAPREMPFDRLPKLGDTAYIVGTL